MRTARRIAASLAALALLPGAATAADGPRLTEAKGAKFPDRTFVLSLPERSRIDAAKLDVRENGRRVENLQVVPGDQAGPRSFGVVLAVDASLTMRGEPVRDAVAAARAFAAQRKPNQQLGVLFFSRETRVGLPLTADGARIERALATVPEVTKGTRIWDTGLAAVRMLEQARIQAGTVVILSDGADVGSTISSGELAAAARKARVRIYTVGLPSASFNPATLGDIAAVAHGTYAEAGSSAKLERIYAALGQQLSSEYLVRYRSLAALGSDVTVEARVAGESQVASAGYQAPALGLPTATLPEAPSAWSSPAAIVLAALLVGGLFGLALMLVLRGPQATVQDRIAAYVRPRAAGADPYGELPGGTLRASLVERILERAGWWPKYAEAVELSGIGMSPSQLALATMTATASLMWLAAATGRGLAAVLLAFMPVVVYFVLRSRIERMRREFADQLVDNLQVVASAMRAGHSFEGGLAVAAEDASEPMRGELRRIVSDERLGVPLQEAMGAVARRMNSKELDNVALIVTTQREAGGNIAELLDRAVESLRHRAELRRLVQGLTAQGRAGGVVVTAMPFAMALLLSLISPGFFDPMLEVPAGRALMVFAGLLVGAGWLVIRRIVDIKV